MIRYLVPFGRYATIGPKGMSKMPSSGHSQIRKALQRLMNWIRRGFRKEPDAPLDPYAYVGAPKKPQPSNRNAAAVAELPEE